MYPPRNPTSPAGTTANTPLVAITYRKEARVLRYERQLYGDLGHFYLHHRHGAEAEAEADWAARREWTTQRAGIDDGTALADALAQLYDGDQAPPTTRTAEDELGLALQKEARRRFGRELSRDDVRLLRDVGGDLDELVEYLAQFDDDDYGAATATTATGPGLKVYSDAELEAQGYALDVASRTTSSTGYYSRDFAPGTSEPRTLVVSSRGGAAAVIEEDEEEEEEENDDDDDGVPEHRIGRFDLPAVYQHLVSPLDNHPFSFSSSPPSSEDDDDDADPFTTTTNGRHRRAARVPCTTTTTAAGIIARALREKTPPGASIMHLPSLPPAEAAAWQKEAVAVCRLLLMRVARRLDTVQRQLAILERPPPSSPSASAARRARFRRQQQQRQQQQQQQQQQRECLGGGSPYMSSPLAKG